MHTSGDMEVQPTHVTITLEPLSSPHPHPGPRKALPASDAATKQPIPAPTSSYVTGSGPMASFGGGPSATREEPRELNYWY